MVVYVNLLDEGSDAARPTEAIELGNGHYRLLPTANYDPEDEHWEFPPVQLSGVNLVNSGVLCASSLFLARRRRAKGIA
jgi:hypothetical protein